MTVSEQVGSLVASLRLDSGLIERHRGEGSFKKSLTDLASQSRCLCEDFLYLDPFDAPPPPPKVLGCFILVSVKNPLRVSTECQTKEKLAAP